MTRVLTEKMSTEKLPMENLLTKTQITELFDTARAYRLRAYTPYSHFQVGAALLTKEGKIYGGCNIENAAYGPSNCAERTAFFKAVSEGEHDFRAIAIVGGPENAPVEFCPPCGVCRQVMAEFCDAKEFVILLEDDGEIRQYLLKDILPLSFGADNLSM